MSTPGSFTGYTAVDFGRGARSPALPAPVLPNPTTTSEISARMLISWRAPGAHREWERTFVPSARSYSFTCTMRCSPLPARYATARTGRIRKAAVTDNTAGLRSPQTGFGQPFAQL